MLAGPQTGLGKVFVFVFFFNKSPDVDMLSAETRESSSSKVPVKITLLDLHRQKTDQWLPGAGVKGGHGHKRT